MTDYKKKYEEALAKAREILRDDVEKRPYMKWLFPELRESEGERIRKEIVRFIQMEVEDEIVGNKWLTWLNKQGQEKH